MSARAPDSGMPSLDRGDLVAGKGDIPDAVYMLRRVDDVTPFDEQIVVQLFAPAPSIERRTRPLENERSRQTMLLEDALRSRGDGTDGPRTGAARPVGLAIRARGSRKGRRVTGGSRGNQAYRRETPLHEFRARAIMGFLEAA